MIEVAKLNEMTEAVEALKIPTLPSKSSCLCSECPQRKKCETNRACLGGLLDKALTRLIAKGKSGKLSNADIRAILKLAMKYKIPLEDDTVEE